MIYLLKIKGPGINAMGEMSIQAFGSREEGLRALYEYCAQQDPTMQDVRISFGELVAILHYFRRHQNQDWEIVPLEVR